MWANVVRTNVTWTNVPIIVGICSRWSQEPFKFGQNRVSNSWDIHDMEKCCLDKCQCGSWHLLKMVPGTYFKRLVKNWVSNSWDIFWYGQMSPGQMLPGQMSSCQLEYVQDRPRNLPLKFDQNQASNSWDIADIEFAVGGWWWWWVWKVIFVLG